MFDQDVVDSDNNSNGDDSMLIINNADADTHNDDSNDYKDGNNNADNDNDYEDDEDDKQR